MLHRRHPRISLISFARYPRESRTARKVPGTMAAKTGSHPPRTSYLGEALPASHLLAGCFDASHQSRRQHVDITGLNLALETTAIRCARRIANKRSSATVCSAPKGPSKRG